MSARQRRRLADAAARHEVEESEESSEEDATPVPEAAKPAFAAFVSDDSDFDESDDSSSQSDQIDGAAVQDAAPLVAQAAEEKQASSTLDDDALLAEAIAEARLRPDEGVDVAATAHGNAHLAFLRCDMRCLNVENELRKKFGAGAAATAAADAAEAQPARRQRRVTAPAPSAALRKLMLGPPSDEWSKPPSRVGGGLGMEKASAPAYLPTWQAAAHGPAATWFTFVASDTYQQLQAKYEAVQATMDPNMLALFASTADYHAECLLQLGMILAHTGSMDRAGDMVRHCLYVLENAYAEGFGAAQGKARLDAAAAQNATYFDALFRHMQMTGMRGCPRTATEVCRLLLSLDPLGDPNGALLFLDHYAIASKQPEVVISLFDSGLPVGIAPAALASAAGAAAPLPPPLAAAAAAVVSDLPNLSISRGLALLDANATGNAQQEALEAMRQALLRFPAALQPLLDKAGVDTRSQNWKHVLRHGLFAGAVERLQAGPPPSELDQPLAPPPSPAAGRGSGAAVLVHLLRAFAQRNGDIWKHERCLELLYDGAAMAVQEADRQYHSEGSSSSGSSSSSGGGGISSSETEVSAEASPDPALCGVAPSAWAQWFDMGGTREEASVMRRAYRADTPLRKYLAIPLHEFQDGYSQMPVEGLLNPQLMGPNMLRRPVQGQGAAALAGGGRLRRRQLMEFLQAAQQNARRGGDGAAADELQGIAEGLERGRLDPNAPLMQLFLQSLLPWNTMPTPLNPPPPPPPGL